MIGLSDGLGTTLETQYRYEPYGKTRMLGQASRNTQQYTGRENDATGLYYYRARYYDPETGRFVSPDPIGWAAGQTNGYAYVNGNPIIYTDPSGLANSGIPKQVPGTTNTVRIDPPHVAGQQSHAHIYDKNGNLITAINKDGTGSHGKCPSDLPKNKKLREFLMKKGFALGAIGDLLLLKDWAQSTMRAIDPMNPYGYDDPSDMPDWM
ncbi:hypothetical protein BKK79_27970 [Cupriavidus sp. USMAA2-4]|uniref:RHS repeat-associated core domain-containing protein n=1 Tax=Cupriavidus sp. USMAA2-4 TaxID=876364 RepID=UPI0008A6CE6D|nr:RHS repeat-associated core domain-containing protein [Cupriavidus sp. USMAA2-4]AOY95576.1 hypothetical protein BKK79_27970 [Cupriavidus sp. USMAA2-4]